GQTPQKNPAKERSSTELRYASFLAPLWGGGKAVKGRDERQKTGALDSSPNPTRGSVFSFLLDNADVVIDGMLRQLAPGGGSLVLCSGNGVFSFRIGLLDSRLHMQC